MSVTRSGWLEKLSGKIVKTWKKRHVVLHSDSTLAVYDGANDTVADKVLYLKTELVNVERGRACGSIDLPRGHNNIDGLFSLKTSHHSTIYFFASSDNEASDWVGDLFKAKNPEVSVNPAMAGTAQLPQPPIAYSPQIVVQPGLLGYPGRIIGGPLQPTVYGPSHGYVGQPVYIPGQPMHLMGVGSVSPSMHLHHGSRHHRHAHRTAMMHHNMHHGGIHHGGIHHGGIHHGGLHHGGIHHGGLHHGGLHHGGIDHGGLHHGGLHHGGMHHGGMHHGGVDHGGAHHGGSHHGTDHM